MFLAAVDDRLAGRGDIERHHRELRLAQISIPPGSTDDGEQDLVNSGPAGFDRWDLLYPIAPQTPSGDGQSARFLSAPIHRIT